MKCYLINQRYRNTSQHWSVLKEYLNGGTDSVSLSVMYFLRAETWTFQFVAMGMLIVSSWSSSDKIWSFGYRAINILYFVADIFKHHAWTKTEILIVTARKSFIHRATNMYTESEIWQDIFPEITYSTVQPRFWFRPIHTVAQKGHTCKLKMLLQTKNFTCKLKIVHAN